MVAGVSGQCLGQAYCLEETLKIIKGYGVGYMELWPVNVPALREGASNDSYSERDAGQAMALLEKHGVKVSAVSFPGAFDPSIAGSADTYSREFIAAVKVAAQLGAKFVNHYCFLLSLESLDEKRLFDSIRPALELAEESSITLVLENEAHDMTKTPEEMLAILRLFDHPCFKTNFDAANYYHAGCEGFPYAYDALQGHIAYVHIKNGCEYHPRAGHHEKYKGTGMTGHASGKDFYYPTIPDGAVNFEGLIARLRKDGYDGFCVAEPHCPPEDITEYLDVDLRYLTNKIN